MRPSEYRNFGEPLTAGAETVPEHLAFVYLDDEEREHEITTAELHERALGTARDLLASVRPGDRVLLLLPPGLDYVATVFGCFYAGVIGVSAPPPQPTRLERTLGRLLRIAEDAGTAAAVTTTPFLEAAQAVIPAEHRLAMGGWLTADTVSPAADVPGLQRPRPDDLAFLQYTSGSTAAPRGVRLSHANLLDNSRFIASQFGHDPELSLGFNWIPPFHDMGLVGAILQPVYFGGLHAVDAARNRDPKRPASVLASPLAVVKRPIRWLQGVSRYQATASGGPDFSYDMCVQRIRAEDCEGLDLSSWEIAFTGAEPIRSETLGAFARRFRPHGFRSTAFFPVYGLAEATLMVTAVPKSREPTLTRFEREALLENRAVPSGREDDPLLVGCGGPDDRHRVEIVDPKSRVPAAPGKIGEIWVSGPSVAGGYWGEDRGTFGARLARAEGDDRFLRTGDLGVFHEDELYVMGRLSDLIILHGRNLHPHDIELLAEAADPILIPHASAAFELWPGRGEPRVALVAESRSTDDSALQKAIITARREIAAELGLPLAMAVICPKGAVPKTTSGKIQRHLCRSLLLSGKLEVTVEWRAPAVTEARADK